MFRRNPGRTIVHMHNVEAFIEELFVTLRTTWKEALNHADLDSATFEDVVKRVQAIDSDFASLVQRADPGQNAADELQDLLGRARAELRRVRRLDSGVPATPFGWYEREHQLV